MSINGYSCTNEGVVLRSAYTAGSLHGGGAHALFADCHCAFVKDSVGRQVWRSLGSRNGGEIAGLLP